MALIVGEHLASDASSGGRGLTDGERWAAIAIAVALLPSGLELMHRAHHGVEDFSASAYDRYVEHLPQALFVGEDMPHATVIANDIGFLAFYAPDANILDPLGLGSIEPVLLQRSHQKVDPYFMQMWASQKGAQLCYPAY